MDVFVSFEKKNLSSDEREDTSRQIQALVDDIRINGASRGRLSILKRRLRPFINCRCAEAMAEYLKGTRDEVLAAEGVYCYRMDERVIRVVDSFLRNHITLEVPPDAYRTPFLKRYLDEVAPEDGTRTFMDYLEDKLQWNVVLYEPEATMRVLAIQDEPDEKRAQALRADLADFLLPLLFDCVARSVQNIRNFDHDATDRDDIGDFAQSIAAERILKAKDAAAPSNVYRFKLRFSPTRDPREDYFTGQLQSVLLHRRDNGRPTNIVAKLVDRKFETRYDQKGNKVLEVRLSSSDMDNPQGSHDADTEDGNGGGGSDRSAQRRMRGVELCAALEHSRKETLRIYCMTISSLVEPHLLRFCINIDGLDTAKHGWVIDESYLLTYHLWLLVAGIMDAEHLFDDKVGNSSMDRLRRLIRKGDAAAGIRPYGRYTKDALVKELVDEYRETYLSQVNFIAVLEKRIAQARVGDEPYISEKAMEKENTWAMRDAVTNPLGRVVRDDKTRAWFAELRESIMGIASFIDEYEGGHLDGI